MEARRVIWPPWICFALGLCAAAPYVHVFAAFFLRIQSVFMPFGGTYLLWGGMLFGALSLLMGWVLLAGDKVLPKSVVIPCAWGMALGALGIVANALVLAFFAGRF